MRFTIVTFGLLQKHIANVIMVTVDVLNQSF